jgi:GGDEF domain-containing protein
MEGGLIALVITAVFSGSVLLSFRLRKQHFVEKRLQVLAASDASTGAATKEVLEASMMTAWRKAKHGGRYLSLLVVDIDGFRDFGDAAVLW